jgi:hypothetical protein
VVAGSDSMGTFLFYDVVLQDSVTAYIGRPGYIPLPASVGASDVPQVGTHSPRYVKISVAGTIHVRDMLLHKVPSIAASKSHPLSSFRLSTTLTNSMTSILVGTNMNYVFSIGWSGLLVGCMNILTGKESDGFIRVTKGVSIYICKHLY